MKTKISLTFLLFSFQLFGQTLIHQKNWWQVKGIVSSIYMDTTNNLLYAGGDFSFVGPSRRYGAKIDKVSGEPMIACPDADGVINSVISDGNGGWYVAGDFTRIGDSARYRLAHLDSLGEVMGDVKTGFNDELSRIYLTGNTLYATGIFTSIANSNEFKENGTVLNGITGIPLQTSQVPNDEVLVSVADGNGGWYIGGNFTVIGGVLRNHIAHIDQNGQVTSWNPNANKAVTAIAVYNDKVYIGGDFTKVGELGRSHLAEIDAVTGDVTPWVLSASAGVDDMVVSGTKLYICGSFTTLGGYSRSRIGQIDLLTGFVTSWDPSASNQVTTLDVVGTTVYAGGLFSTIGGQSRSYLAALDVVTGLATSWNPTLNGYVKSLDHNGNTLYVTGNFSNLNSVARNKVGAFNLLDGSLSSWNPSPIGSTNFVAVSSDGMTVYLAGSFGSIGGQTRRKIGAVDAVTGVVTSWNPNSTGIGEATTLSVSGTNVYAGGPFLIGGTDRSKIVAIDVSTDVVSAWDPLPNDWVGDIVSDGSKVYLSGNFTTIAGQSRNRLAAFDCITGLIEPWNPNANNTVYTMKLVSNTVYIGGTFTSVSGQTRNRLAAVDASAGTLTTWNPNASNYVNRMVIDGSDVFVAGAFTTIGGQPKQYIAKLNLTTGAVDPWNVSMTSNGGFVLSSCIHVTPTSVYVSGQFDQVNGLPRNMFAEVDRVTGATLPFICNLDARINSIAESGSGMYIGGLFRYVDGMKCTDAVAFDCAAGKTIDWYPNILASVSTIARHGETVFVGGNISSVNGVACQNFAAIDAVTAAIRPWTINVNGDPFCMAVSPGTLFVGGDISTVNGQQRKNGFAVNPVTGALKPWNPDVDPNAGAITDLEYYKNKIFAAGSFNDQIVGIGYSYLAGFDTLNGMENSWNWNLLDPCTSIDILNDTLYVCGAFNYVNGQSRNFAAGFDLTSGLLIPWNPDLDQPWSRIEASNESVFLGDMLQTNTLSTIKPFTAVDRFTGQLSPWNPTLYWREGGIYPTVADMIYHDGKLFFAGIYDDLFNDPWQSFSVFNACYSTSSVTNQFACNDYNWHGNTYTTSGTYSRQLTNAAGCDSIAYLHLTIGNVTTTEQITSCGSYTWTDGVTYSNSGTYTRNLNTIYGCDSTAIMELTIQQPSAGTDVISACDSHTWIDGVVYTSNNNSATYILQNSNGCDSVVTLNLTILPATSTNVSQTACNNYFWPTNGNTYSASGVYSHILQNAIGCDSIVTLNLTIHPSLATSETISACDSFEWTNGITYTQSTNSPQQFFTAANGCDSIVTLNLTIHPSLATSETISACGSFEWTNGITYTQSTNSPQQFFTTANGCDSIVTLNLTILNSVSMVDVVSACGAYLWQDGVVYTSSTTSPMVVLQTAEGCDSIVSLDLTILNSPAAGAVDQGDGSILASGNGDYQWLDCQLNALIPGENGVVFEPIENGEFAVIVTGPDCADTSDCVVIDYLDQQSLLSNKFAVYPNPSSNQVTIVMTLQSALLTITDARGRCIKEMDIQNGELISIEELANGVYTFAIQNLSVRLIKRVVKED